MAPEGQGAPAEKERGRYRTVPGNFEVRHNHLGLESTPREGGQEALGTDFVDFGTFSGSGVIAGPSFGRNFEGVSGEFNGAFFGPGAAEMGYGFFFIDDTVRFRGDVVGIKE